MAGACERVCDVDVSEDVVLLAPAILLGLLSTDTKTGADEQKLDEPSAPVAQSHGFFGPF
jgi:hypothetical protein